MQRCAASPQPSPAHSPTVTHDPPPHTNEAEQSSANREPAANGDDGYFDLGAADHESSGGARVDDDTPSISTSYTTPVVDQDGYAHWDYTQTNGKEEPAGLRPAVPSLSNTSAQPSAPEISSFNQGVCR